MIRTMPERSYRPGSAEDFDRLYRDSYTRLLYALLAVLPDRADAEDCVQETFVKAYANWSRWRPEAPAEAWLHRIALRVASSHRRRERLRGAGETVRRLGRPTADGGTDPAMALDLQAALRRLPAQQAFVIILRHHHGYTNREIAAGLGLPESTVASRLAAARARLQLDLGAAADAAAPREEDRGPTTADAAGPARTRRADAAAAAPMPVGRADAAAAAPVPVNRGDAADAAAGPVLADRGDAADAAARPVPVNGEAAPAEAARRPVLAAEPGNR